MNPEIPLNLSDGGVFLLVVARENDSYGALEKNVALLKVLEFGQNLIHACKRQGVQGLYVLLGTTSPARTFLMITAAALHEIRRRMHEYVKGKHGTASAARDFDWHALQGFAEALADVAWPRRNANDFDGPAAEEFVSRLAQTELTTMWLRTVQHYLANILQDNFAALRMRERVPELDPATEIDLRLLDARLLAERTLNIYQEIRGGQDDPEFLALALYQTINETLRGQANQ